VPELPDVEGFRRELARTLPGRRVREVDVLDAGVLRNTTARALARKLADHRFGEPRRARVVSLLVAKRFWIWPMSGA